MKSASFFLLTIVCIGMIQTNALADVAKGQKWYVKSCKDCHGSGVKGAAMHTQDEWNELFADEKILIDKHAGTKAENYFNGNEFRDKSKHIRDFLFEYGSDSGNLPPC